MTLCNNLHSKDIRKISNKKKEISNLKTTNITRQLAQLNTRNNTSHNEIAEQDKTKR